MPVLYTERAEADLDQIAAYTRDKWGAAQCARYVESIGGCCRALADGSLSGRIHSTEWIYFRYRCRKHVIFYRHVDPATVLIVRVLHQRMLPELHLANAEDSISR
jgi:toxin ParE1/3/4